MSPDGGATVFDDDGLTFEPAEEAGMTEPVGAGDSFAAGHLYRLLCGEPTQTRIACGHHVATRALRTTSDFADPKG